MTIENKIEETRVGYMAISMIAKETKDYILANTVDKHYVGDVEYLIKYNNMIEYLRDEEL